MEDRDMKTILCYVKHVMKENNDLLREILLEMRNEYRNWLAKNNNYI